MEELLKKIVKEALEEVSITAFNKPISTVDEIMTIKQLSEYLQISEGWIYKNMKSIPHLKLSSNTRFRKNDINKWLDEQANDINYNQKFSSTVKGIKKSNFKVV